MKTLIKNADRVSLKLKSALESKTFTNLLTAHRKTGCWSRRTSVEKRLTFISILLGLVAVAFLIALIVVAVNNNAATDPEPEPEPEDPLEKICFTPACIAESAVVLKQMNQTADP